MTEEKKTDETRTEKRTIVESVEVAGNQVVDEVKRLVHEGNVRRIKLADKDGDFSLELPVTVGVLAGGALALTAPWLAVLGVVAALIARVQIEVEREEDEEPSETAPDKDDDAAA